MDYLSYNVYIQTKKGYEKLNTTPYKIQIDPSQSSQLMNLRQFSRILCSDEQDQYALFTRIAI